MEVQNTARFLLQEITREWEFKHNGKEHTFREYEGMDGRLMWLDGEQVDDHEEEILDDMSAWDIYELCMDFENK